MSLILHGAVQNPKARIGTRETLTGVNHSHSASALQRRVMNRGACVSLIRYLRKIGRRTECINYKLQETSPVEGANCHSIEGMNP